MATVNDRSPDRGSIGPSVCLSKPDCAHHWISYDTTVQDEVIPRLADADIAIVNKIVLDKATIAELPRLKMIAISATGFDKIDIEGRRATRYCGVKYTRLCQTYRA